MTYSIRPKLAIHHSIKYGKIKTASRITESGRHMSTKT